MKSFSERLREAMLLRGVTQAELARLTGLSKSIINGYVSGRRSNPRTDYFYAVAVALDVSEAWLMGCDGVSSGRGSRVPVKASSPEQQRLLRLFGALNGGGRERLLELAEDLSRRSKYR